MTTRFSRRSLLQGLGAGALAVGAARAGLGRSGTARADIGNAVGETPHLVIIYLEGGLNALFCSANSFLGAAADRSFGVTSSNIQRLGTSDVYVDSPTIGQLPASALQHLAVIGCAHGLSAHPTARNGHFNDSSDTSRMLVLAEAMGGAGTLKACSVGSHVPYGNNSPVGDVSLQPVPDVASVLSGLGGSDPLAIDRDAASAAIMSAKAQSAADFSASPQRLDTLRQAYDALPPVLGTQIAVPSLATLNAAYGLPAASTSASNMKEQLRAAELMIQTGSNVITAISLGWDSHGDISGQEVRDKMAAEIIPGLSIFLQRTLADTTRNVVTVITGDFSRSLPGSNHQPNLSSMMFGRYCKLATTGHVDGNVGLPAGFTPGLNEHWSALAAALKLSSNPFGANPHTALIV